MKVKGGFKKKSLITLLVCSLAISSICLPVAVATDQKTEASSQTNQKKASEKRRKPSIHIINKKEKYDQGDLIGVSLSSYDVSNDYKSVKIKNMRKDDELKEISEKIERTVDKKKIKRLDRVYWFEFKESGIYEIDIEMQNGDQYTKRIKLK